MNNRDGLTPPILVRILNQLEGHTGHAVEQLPHVYRGRCPLHPEDGPMLLVRGLSGGGVVIDCAAGCSARVVAESLGLEFRDLFLLEKLL
ncbi:MAG: hypothetical protein C0485_15125 [Pirellula sp.]|nr:hypothetical protein [Pirellula sp.]